MNPSSYLARITTRLALNVVQSARARHEIGTHHWHPETIDPSTDPATRAERAEELELALRLLLEKLTPLERAAFVLRVAFDYPYSEIAANLQLSQVNTRQIVSRARKRLFAERGEPVSATDYQRFIEAFGTAAQAGDLTGLEDLLIVDTGRNRIQAAYRWTPTQRNARRETEPALPHDVPLAAW
nr:sigma-70 family RNA polymerase sigma factor [Streptomyces sp. N502]